ncbi:hypothetical protein BRADI_1g21233v3 [Brachypodium distachyon]|uniref:Uncharacterized protein n=1 Tax=Brachypodium distachyon TaxID=15368 RepID=A0A0Q3NDG8_BRADI|nr:hypothetical protein BRADI_1g21233v3 [Brachypodium distachyon]
MWDLPPSVSPPQSSLPCLPALPSPLRHSSAPAHRPAVFACLPTPRRPSGLRPGRGPAPRPGIFAGLLSQRLPSSLANPARSAPSSHAAGPPQILQAPFVAVDDQDEVASSEGIKEAAGAGELLCSGCGWIRLGLLAPCLSHSWRKTQPRSLLASTTTTGAIEFAAAAHANEIFSTEGHKESCTKIIFRSPSQLSFGVSRALLAWTSITAIHMSSIHVVIQDQNQYVAYTQK